MPFWVFLDYKLKKTIVIFGNQHSRICRNEKNCAKQKKIEFGTKMSYLGILCCTFEKVLSYLKSASRICQNAKFRTKSKPLIFGTKNA